MTLAVYCAGGLGRELISMARSVCRWDHMAFVDDVTDATECLGARVFRFDDVKNIPDQVEFIIANGEPAAREKLYHRIKAAGYPMATVCGYGCAVLPGAQLGEGCILSEHTTVSAGVVLEPNVYVSTRTIIGHDTTVGAHSVLSANCFVGGCAEIGRRVYLAPGAMVKDRVRVGEDSIISMGAVILRHVKPKAIMLGNPAKRIGENTEGRVFGMFDNE